MLVDISKIVVNETTQARANIDAAVIDKMIDDLRAGDVFKAIDVFLEDGIYYLSDGWHRVTAHTKAGRPLIEANVRDGGARDAYLASLKANDGMPLSLIERKCAASRLLSDAEWSRLPDREIGRRCGMHGETIGDMRKKLSAENRQMTQLSENKKETRSLTTEIKTESKAKPGPNGEDGSKTAAAMVAVMGNPSETNASIARKVGCDPNIVRKVRRRIAASVPEPKVSSVKATRNGRTYDIKTTNIRTNGRKRAGLPPRLSTKAWDIMKGTDQANDTNEKRRLAKLNKSLQIQVAKRLRDSESTSVSGAVEEIMRGAPVTLWEKAYAAICALDGDDRVRLCRMVLSENERPLSVVK